MSVPLFRLRDPKSAPGAVFIFGGRIPDKYRKTQQAREIYIRVDIHECDYRYRYDGGKNIKGDKEEHGMDMVPIPPSHWKLTIFYKGRINPACLYRSETTIWNNQIDALDVIAKASRYSDYAGNTLEEIEAQEKY